MTKKNPLITSIKNQTISLARKKLNIASLKLELWQIILLLIFLICCNWSLPFPGLPSGHDLNHQARIYEMAQGLKQGTFPVIWSQNLSYGYGMPLFEFYAPLPYYTGALFHLIGFSLNQSVELVIITANLITLIGGFLLTKELFKNNTVATLATGILLLFPYRAVNLFVRAAISEAWAMGMLCFVFWSISQIINNRKNSWLYLSLSFAGLILSHNLTALLSMPFLITFGLILILLKKMTWSKRWQRLMQLSFSGLLGLGLAAFYFIPALIEKKFTQVDKFTLSHQYNFHQHFLYIRQFLKPWGEWEFGGSGWGPNDEMSFFLGYAQIFILLIASIMVIKFIYSLIKTKKIPLQHSLHIFILFLTGISLLLTLHKTTFIWELFNFSQYIQFPWRFLTVSGILISLLAGSVYQKLNSQQQKIFFTISIILLLTINPKYFRSEKNFPLPTEKEKSYYQHIKTKNSSNLFDYMPENLKFFRKKGFYVYKNPQNQQVQVPATSFFPKSIANFSPQLHTETTTRKEFSLTATHAAEINLNLAYYPGWTTKINQRETETYANDLGLLSFQVPTGKHKIQVQLKDTPIRRWSKIISGVSLIILFVNLFIKRKKD